jgi:predicted subunit of tRNA(5-methylaminomethyl-2-thiouridylate) methyltransferase
LAIFQLASNIVRAYQNLGHPILALESDMEVVTKVLEPFIEVAMPELDAEHVHNFSIDSLVKEHSKRLLDCE